MLKPSRNIVALSMIGLTSLMMQSASISPHAIQVNCISTCLMKDSSVISIPGDDVIEGDDFGEDTSSLTSIPPSRDTLYAYTLTGLRLDGRRNSSTRTLYNITIRNGRKVVRR